MAGRTSRKASRVRESPSSLRTPSASPSPARNLAQHSYDFALDGANVALDLFQGARGHIVVEVAVEVDLVADTSNPAVLWIPLVEVNPRLRHVGTYLPIEELAHARGQAVRVRWVVSRWQRHALCIPQLRVGL